MKLKAANWIGPEKDTGDVCPVFWKEFSCPKPVSKAEMRLTALGVYEAKLNGRRVSDYVLAPGWTVYEKRLQYQQYDITELLQKDNSVTVTVGRGWLRSRMGWGDVAGRMGRPCGILGVIHIRYEDGTEDLLHTDSSWLWAESGTRSSDFYDGETYDATYVPDKWQNVRLIPWTKDILIPQEGEEIREMERVCAKEVFVTPKGEMLIDFGQEVTGYVEFTLAAKGGEQIKILHGEILDRDGNFYNENYRSAKSEICYTCKEGIQTWHPALTFYGFRYIKVEGLSELPKPEQFTAIVVYSDIKQTGSLCCSDPKLNQLFSNIFWGQKGNFLDVPTDCPQRDERLGWTGDAQAFIKTAAYNFDVERFFRKWLRDLAAEQRENGGVGCTIPDYLDNVAPSAAWSDAATICPWQLYLTYGNEEALREQFDSMKRWVDYVTNATTTPCLWTGGVHFGDWLALDAGDDEYKGATREDFIASAFYAHSADLLIRAGKVIGEDVADYEQLHSNIVRTFRETYPEYLTQTEHVLAVQFGLAPDLQQTADDLAKMVRSIGCKIQTGFVGTPYILHVLSDYGYPDIAYSLLLREDYPSWLYSVNQGATTVWEHWDGIKEDGSFWSADMNSYNHYAYGAVADWVYEKAAGIQPVESAPGFAEVRIAPTPDRRLEWLEASVMSRHGEIRSKWTHTDSGIRYDIKTAVPATVVIDGKETAVAPGSYIFWG